MNGWQASVLWIALICLYATIKSYIEKDKPIMNEFCAKCGQEVFPEEEEEEEN